MTTALIPAPPLTALASLAVDGLASAHSRRAYETAIRDFAQWCRDTGAAFDKRSVNTYKAVLQSRGLAASSINVRLAAIRKLALEAGDNGLMPADVAAAIGRVKGEKAQGVRCGNWLDRAQTKQILAQPDRTRLIGKRDYCVLSLMLGAALRRSEAASLTVEHIAVRESRTCIVDMKGKGGKLRTVVLPQFVAAAVREWLEAAGITEGAILRQVNRGGKVGKPMSAARILSIVANYGERIGVTLRPHDCRRTASRLAYKGGADLEQIRLSLGHADTATTLRYLNSTLDLENAAFDYLGI